MNKVHPIEPLPDVQKVKNSPSQSGKQCRICLDEETASQRLLRVCRCSGSVKYVHKSCIIRCIQQKLKTKVKLEKQKLIQDGMECQICKFFIKFDCESSLKCKTLEQLKDGIEQHCQKFWMLIIIITLTLIGIASLSYVLQILMTRYLNKQMDITLPILAISGIFLFFCFFSTGIFLMLKYFILCTVNPVIQVAEYKQGQLLTKKSRFMIAYQQQRRQTVFLPNISLQQLRRQ